MRRIHLKPEAATKGFFYLTHDLTGKVYTATASNMLDEILLIREELANGRCKNRRMTRLSSEDSEFVAKFIPTASIKEARRLEKEFRSDKPDYLLLN